MWRSLVRVCLPNSKRKRQYATSIYGSIQFSHSLLQSKSCGRVSSFRCISLSKQSNTPHTNTNPISLSERTLTQEQRKLIHQQRADLEKVAKRLCVSLRTELDSECTLTEATVSSWNSDTRRMISDIHSTIVNVQELGSMIASDVMWLERRLSYEIELGFEGAIAIAMKQRNFKAADMCYELLLSFHPQLVPTNATFSYLIQGVGLRQTAKGHHKAYFGVTELRKWIDMNSSAWEGKVLHLLTTEKRPHYLKSDFERNRLRDQLLHDIQQLLQQYETFVQPHPSSSLREQLQLTEVNESTLQDDAHQSHPFMIAMEVCARNTVPFKRLLHLMVQRKRNVRQYFDAKTMYLPLLDSARWGEIPATIEQFVLENQQQSFESVSDIQLLVQMWQTSMKSICNSFTSRYFHRYIHMSSTELEGLRKVFHHTEETFRKLMPVHHTDHKSTTFLLSETDYENLFRLRIKAAAMCGLHNSVLEILDQYIAADWLPVEQNGARTHKKVFLIALEIFSSVHVQLLELSSKDWIDRSFQSDITRSSKFLQLEQKFFHLTEHVIPETVNLCKSKLREMENSEQADKVMAMDMLQFEMERALSQKLRLARTLSGKIIAARTGKGRYSAVRQVFRQADTYVDDVIEKLLDLPAELNLYNVDGDLDVDMALMTQYLTCANRFEHRLRAQSVVVGPHLMKRVFRILDNVDNMCSVASERNRASAEETLSAVRNLFWLAARTAAILARPQDLERVYSRRFASLSKLDATPSSPSELTAREYDLLIYAFSAQHQFVKAWELFQIMQNNGLVPTRDTIHRMILLQLRTLAADASYSPRKPYRDDEENVAPLSDEEIASNEIISDLERELYEEEFGQEHVDDKEGGILPYSGHHQLSDIVTFIQDWYNRAHVTPYSKTALPVLERLIMAKDKSEVIRFVQSLHSMKAISPVLHVWLENRLKDIGLSREELNLNEQEF
ncbi:unnamed protein product [Albugo candida]|uniref:Uncharacterized protein n=1 Tax=Albugo candida TaxID=65357 RepID=A0A024GDM2_9STRA|nr:unnamed protein product [Albugo candida]|eukprot:CCI44951.1 unnamed protein product [Albugo candida]